MERIQITYQPVGYRCTYPDLRDLEYQEHDHCEDGNAEPFVGKNGVYGISEVSVFCKDFTVFDLFYNGVDVFKTFSVSFFYGMFVRKVDISLYVRGLLLFACMGYGRFDHSLEAFVCC